jgi:hypothetical protein
MYKIPMLTNKIIIEYKFYISYTVVKQCNYNIITFQLYYSYF